MFRRKKGELTGDGSANEGDGDMIAPPLKPFAKRGSHTPSKPPSSPTFHPDIPRRSPPEIPRRSPPEIPGIQPRRAEHGSIGAEDSNRLVIGRDITLNGTITSCDSLVVEGRVEVVLQGAQTIEVTASGFFKGSADVEEADISGRFEGELVARDQLILRAGGHINGTIRYGRIVIEAGGEVSGDMQALEAATTNEGGADEDSDSETGAGDAPKPKRGGAKTPAGKK